LFEFNNIERKKNNERLENEFSVEKEKMGIEKIIDNEDVNKYVKEKK
jgi:hypothetical protein